MELDAPAWGANSVEAPMENPDEPAQRMYFDLCPDAIANITRYTSSRPNGPAWTNFIAAGDVSSMSNVEEGLGCMSAKKISFLKS